MFQESIEHHATSGDLSLRNFNDEINLASLSLRRADTEGGRADTNSIQPTLVPQKRHTFPNIP